MTAFQVGKAYQTRLISDWQAIIRHTVIARTASTVTLDNGKRFRVKVYEQVEQIKPLGSYSMAPILSADKLAAGEG